MDLTPAREHGFNELDELILQEQYIRVFRRDSAALQANASGISLQHARRYKCML